MYLIIGQIIGFIAVGTSFLSTIQLKRKNVILFKLITDIVWIVSNFMIGSYPAAITFVMLIYNIYYHAVAGIVDSILTVVLAICSIIATRVLIKKGMIIDADK